MDRIALDGLIDGYADGTLDVGALASLDAILRADPSARRRFWQRQRLHAQLVVACRAVTGSAQARAPRGLSSRYQRRLFGKRPLWRWWPLAAALLLAALGGVLWQAGSTTARSPLANLRVTAPGARLTRDGHSMAAQAGMDLLPQDRLEVVDGSAEVQYPDQTTIEARSGTRLRLWDEAGAKRMQLDRGELYCEVARQPAGKALRVLTDEAGVEVVGTRFVIHRDGIGTRLEVNAGRVRFTEVQTGATVEVGTGGSAETHPPAGQTATPRLRVRTAGTNAHRIIEAVDGTPFFIAGWAPQNIVHALPVTRFDPYFQAMRGKGFNTAWVLAAGWDGRHNPSGESSRNPHDHAGHALQLDPDAGGLDAANLNPLYVASVDALVDAAGRNGVCLFLDVMNEPGQAFARRGQKECVSWGRFWGERYVAKPQVNFVLGNNALPQPQANWVVSGIRQGCADRLFAINVPSIPDDNAGDGTPNPMREILGPNRATWINVRAWQAGEDRNAWNPGCAYQYAAYRMYAEPSLPPAPAFLFEAEYSHWHPDTVASAIGQGYGTIAADYRRFGGKPGSWTLRRQIWSQPLGGGAGFGILGNWDQYWDDPARFLNDPLWTYAGVCRSFFAERRWDALAPDYGHAFLISQATDPARQDYAYVSAAIAADSSFGVIYLPGLSGQGRDLTIAMSKLGGGTGTARARWFDPTSGAYTEISGSPFANTGSRTFTAPAANAAGAGDWVLVLEADNGLQR